MNITSIISCLENKAPLVYQDEYDNAGLIAGHPEWPCTGVLVTLDVTEKLIAEAVSRQCNLVVTHHPILFRGMKKINGKTDEERALIAAIKHEVAIYAIHTNLDNLLAGVNGKIADKLGLVNRHVLAPKQGTLKKLFTFVPQEHAEFVRNALFQAGAGTIGNYTETSFSTPGTGTFKAGPGSQPFVGELGKRHLEPEIRIEVVFPVHAEQQIVKALIKSHPYEEAAYDIFGLENVYAHIGSGVLGELTEPSEERAFISRLKDIFQVPMVRHSSLRGKPVKRVALCGGSGSFLIFNALASKADFFVTADLKYHDFFGLGDQMVLADIGHYESEQFTIDLLHEILREKFPTFAVLKPDTPTNPVHYYF